VVLDAFLEKAMDNNGAEVSFILWSQQMLAGGRQLTFSVFTGMYRIVLIALASGCCTPS
jgi:hypothetical protein